MKTLKPILLAGVLALAFAPTFACAQISEHTDVLRLGKPFSNANKLLEFNIGTSIYPQIRYNTSTSKIEYSSDGTHFNGLGTFTVYPPAIQTFASGSGTYYLDYTFAISSGNATTGATYSNNGVTFTVNQTVSSANTVVMWGSGPPSASGTLTKVTGTGDATITFSSFRSPTYLEVKMVGGGGGGSGAPTGGSAGGTGGSTTFGSSLLIANGGVGAVYASTYGGLGGSASIGSGATGIAQSGGVGAPQGANVAFGSGGNGAVSPFGGAGCGAINQGSVTESGDSAAGYGSGGGGSSGNTGYAGGGGGGAGGFIDAIISSPNSSYSYAVGSPGSGGTGGSGGAGGGSGGSGVIIVTEHYQ